MTTLQTARTLRTHTTYTVHADCARTHTCTWGGGGDGHACRATRAVPTPRQLFGRPLKGVGELLLRRAPR
jgi:hypothetical protein